MKIFSSLKNQAVNFLEPYKQKEPATYAAAEQAIGAILIADGLTGLDNPMGNNKRPGIFGTLGGMVVGVIFMLIPTFFGNLTHLNTMTATTGATVVSIGAATTSTNSSGQTSSTCPLTVKYTVDSKDYTKSSSLSQSDYCNMSVGQTITINYDPASPATWIYGAKTLKTIFQIFFWAGLFILISSIFTFIIRLFSIIFGWKLLKDGRKNAAALPADTNFQTIVNEIKQNFTKSVFGFGGVGGNIPVAQNPVVNPPTKPEI